MLGADLVTVFPAVYGVDVNATFLRQFSGRYFGDYFFNNVAHGRVIHQSMYFTQTFCVLKDSYTKCVDYVHYKCDYLLDNNS